jgi:DNA-binding NarL/FixJ family response regulator
VRAGGDEQPQAYAEASHPVVDVAMVSCVVIRSVPSIASLLSSREVDVLELFLQFFSDKRVAARLGTRVQTVRNQVASIMQKLCVASRPEMVSVALLAWFSHRILSDSAG